jgi:3-phosphoshikimate 1-carboxyvinyltransferase
VASVAEGKTIIYNAARLRFKESDRIESTCVFLSRLGADITPTDDGMIINGKTELTGGIIDCFRDHRITMSAAIASLVCRDSVTVQDFEVTAKSYPSFAENFN